MEESSSKIWLFQDNVSYRKNELRRQKTTKLKMIRIAIISNLCQG